MDFRFGNFDGIVSLSVFEFVTRPLARLPSYFPNELILLSVREKEYMKIIVGKMVDNMTQGSCILTR